MARLNTCTACGADNDVIFDNCVFCKNPLERIDFTSISNEELISNAADWIQKSREYCINIPNPNYKGNGFKESYSIRVSNGEIRGFASKYLSILSYRASQNPSLIIVYNQLNQDFKKKRINPGFYKMVLPFIISGLIAFAFMSFGIIRENSGKRNEVNRIKQINEEISNMIDNKDFDKALVKADEIIWTYSPDTFTGEVEQYNQQRESTKKTINQLIDSQRQKK